MKRLFRQALCGVAALAGCCLMVTSDAAANPLDAFGFGARAIGLGGAATASVDDFSANYYNPAALARLEGLRLELGYIAVKPSLSINGGDLGVDEPAGFQGGMTLPGKLLGRRLAFSVGIYLPDSRITRVRALPQRQPRFALYDNRPQRLVITASGSVEVFEDLFLGFGLTFLSDTAGQVDIDGIVSASDVGDTELLSAINVALPAVRYPSFGLLYAPGPWRFGLTWREEFSLSIDLAVAVRGDVVFGDQQTVIAEDGSFSVRSVNTNLFSPRQIALGGAYEAERWMVSADLTWLQWSQFPTPTSTVTVNLDVPGLPLEIPPSAVPEDPNFRDILVPRVGAEWVAVDGEQVGVTLRGGYFYEPTPAPDQRGATNFVDNDKHGLSAGLGLRFSDWTEIFPRPIVLDLAVQYIVMPQRVYQKDDPADPVGDYTAQGHLLGGALTCRFLF